MYYHVITISYSSAAMKYFCSVEEEFPFYWGILPTIKGLPLERAHVEGNIVFVDNKEGVLAENIYKFVGFCLEFRQGLLHVNVICFDGMMEHIRTNGEKQ